MVRRTKSKKKKYLGQRSWGGGNVKNRRGKGSRGGKGYAGSTKQRWTYIVKYEPDHFKSQGFVNPTKPVRLSVINLNQIQEQATAGKLKKKDKNFLLEFDGKVLGTGIISVPVTVTAKSFSEKAKKKIEEAGGTATLSEPQKIQEKAAESA